MHKTFRDIARQLKNRLPEINWIDRDKGQLEDPESFHSIGIPGILLGFSEVDWKPGTRGNQTGTCQVTMKLVFRLPTATHEGAAWDDYVQFETLNEHLYEACLEMSPTIGDRRKGGDYYTKNFYVCEQTFDCKLSQLVQINRIPKPGPDIEGTIKATLTIP